MINDKDTAAVERVTCFSAQAKYDVDCERETCPQWIPCKEEHNCVLIAAQRGPHTLQEIGKIYNLTRMRICQIEKSIYKKIKSVS
jgi:hypothetical protein